MWEPQIKLATILLLPLIPAIVVFKVLPKSSAIASGPFKGLNIKLGGGFAAYFLLVLIAIYNYPAPEAEIWTVAGQIADKDVDVDSNLTIEYRPPMHYRAGDDGKFKALIATRRSLTNGEFPTLLFKAGKMSASVALDDATLVVTDPKARSIRIKQPIALKAPPIGAKLVIAEPIN